MLSRLGRTAVLVCALVCVVGCGSINEEFVDRMRENYDLFKPLTLQGIESDSTLDANGNQIRKDALDSWDRLIEAAEEEVE